MKLWALLQRWWHCYAIPESPPSGHTPENWMDSEGHLLKIACSCGRVFWSQSHDE